MKSSKLSGAMQVLAWSGVLLAFQIGAQENRLLNPVDPAAADVAVPRVDYQSPFRSYRAFQPEEVAPWRERNDTVGTIGGWRTYAREAQPAPLSTTTGGEAPPRGAAPVTPQGANDAHAHH